jgi:hypothetical protein
MSDSDSIDHAGLELFGQIVTANVERANWITNQLLEAQQEQMCDIAKAFVEFFKLVELETEVVTTRKLEHALNRYAFTLSHAFDILEKYQANQPRKGS